MLEAFVGRALDSLRAGEPLPPAALAVLLRVYVATGREDVAAPLEAALGLATALGCDGLTVVERAEWLTLFVETSDYTADERLGRAADVFAASLDGGARGQNLDLEHNATALAALLTAAARGRAREAAAAAVSDLEQLVASRYDPGAGLRGCSPAESVAVAAALLAAFDATGRLPYPMLAEEVMLAIRATLPSAPVETVCAAARVLARLARLHDDDGYRATAVLAPSVDFAADAASLLDAVAPSCGSPREEAAYALAVAEAGERS